MFIRCNNVELYYQKLGQGKNLILLHGWMQNVSSFYGIVNDLKQNFTLYIIDLPGFGRSSLPSHPFSVSDYAKTIYEFIKHEKIKKPIVLGHSLGGRIGIKIASLYPDLLDKLILEDAAGIKPKRDVPKKIIYTILKLFASLIPSHLQFKTILRNRFYRLIESDYINANDLKETLTKILAEDLTSDLKKIKVDTLLLWGEKDPTKEASLQNGKKMYRLISRAKMEVFEDVGHFPHLERPELFTYYVKDFC